MQITKIHSMWWGDADNTSVGLIADTDQGINLTIGTPYDTTSIIWDAVHAFPVDQIADYVAPAFEESNGGIA